MTLVAEPSAGETPARRLARQTAGAHRAVESIAFGRSLARGTVSRSSYAHYLLALLEWHGALEMLASRMEHTAVGHVWRDDMARTPLLRQDLRTLGYGHHRVEPAVCHMAPHAWLGRLYVLEGASLGGEVLARRIQRALELESPLRHLQPYGGHSRAHWAAFVDDLNRAASRPADFEQVRAGAEAQFRQVQDLFRTL